MRLPPMPRGLALPGLLALLAGSAACSSSETVDPGVDGGVDSAAAAADAAADADAGADTGGADTGGADTGGADTGGADTGADAAPDVADAAPDAKPDSKPDSKPDVGKDSGKDSGPTGCGVDSDCRAYESYCASKDPCTCLPLGKDEPAPSCPGGGTVTCFVAPCASQRAACVGGACALVPK